MTVTVKKGKLSGNVFCPPSKSFAHRLLIGAALSSGKSKINGIVHNGDIDATLDCISAMGVDFSFENKTVTVDGGNFLPGIHTFPCRESGSTLRFFMPLACAVFGGGKFTGTERLFQRGIGIYEEIFKTCKISIEKSHDFVVLNGWLKAGDYSVKGNFSSQFVTGLLFALSALKEKSTLTVIPPVESRSYIDITVEVLQRFGITITENEPYHFEILPQNFFPIDDVVESDWSNGAFFVALKELGNSLDISGLNDDSIQGDKVCVNYFDLLKNGCSEIDINDCPDLGPVLFAFAAANNGGKFNGIKRLRIKESDRVQTMVCELSKFGIKCFESENSLTVGCGLKTPEQILCGHNDHRIVMALSVLLTLTGGSINQAEAVNKSFPDFFEVLNSIGTEIEYGN